MHRARVFCLSLGDWLDDENVPIEWLADLLKTIHETPNLDWLLLTKRPKNWFPRIWDAFRFSANDRNEPALLNWLAAWMGTKHCAEPGVDPKPPSNVWIGVSVGADQSTALDIPAKIHFLSAEPMLRPLDSPRLKEFDWCIFGGESGHNARPCNIEWIRDGVQQCRAAGVAPFVKQLGAICISANHDDVFTEVRNGIVPGTVWRAPFKDKKGGDMSEWPEDLRVREFPKQ